MRNLLLPICIFILAGCAVTTNYYTPTVQSWHGGNVNTLVDRWGKPDMRTKTSDGNIAYMYQTASYNNNTSPNATNFTPNGRPALNGSNSVGNRGGISYSCITTFVVNPQGQIVTVGVQGHGCYGNASFASRKSNPNSK